jgi:hypothetical protein
VLQALSWAYSQPQLLAAYARIFAKRDGRSPVTPPPLQDSAQP